MFWSRRHDVRPGSARSLLSSGLLALLLVDYLTLAYFFIVIVERLISGPPPAPATINLWVPGPWWLSTLGVAGFAITVWPVTRWLQHRLDDLLDSEHENPYLLLTQLSADMEQADGPDALLPTVAATLAATLKLPYVAITTLASDLRPAATFGTPPPHAWVVDLPLTYRGTRLGTLHASARRRDERLSAGDLQLLADLARHVGITLHTAQLSEALQASRADLVRAREEERRRIRRDLHDGLGPALASLRLQLGALRHHAGANPQALALIDELRGDVRAATAEIRRLVYDLRPPMLDEFGLLEALRNLALTDDQLRRTVEAPEPLTPLPAAVEVAVYRIAAEALHNIVRHARATRCAIRLVMSGDCLVLTIWDDGPGLPPNYLPGVGHRAMQERAGELGGSCTIGPAEGGGTCVTATFPLKEYGDG